MYYADLGIGITTMGIAVVVSNTIVATTIYATCQNAAVAWDQTSDSFWPVETFQEEVSVSYQYG